MTITLQIAEAKWRKVRGLAARLKRAVRRTLQDHRSEGTLTILLADDERLHALNRSFRKKNKPTNVLSFPAAPNPEGYLGDIAIAYSVTATEAKAAGKTLSAHTCHLAVHGTLHLLGFDHIRARDAKVMEAEETRILATIGIADPYTVKPRR
jgi:probable rRNA maturation factor